MKHYPNKRVFFGFCLAPLALLTLIFLGELLWERMGLHLSDQSLSWLGTSGFLQGALIGSGFIAMMMYIVLFIPNLILACLCLYFKPVRSWGNVLLTTLGGGVVLSILSPSTVIFIGMCGYCLVALCLFPKSEKQPTDK